MFFLPSGPDGRSHGKIHVGLQLPDNLDGRRSRDRPRRRQGDESRHVGHSRIFAVSRRSRRTAAGTASAVSHSSHEALGEYRPSYSSIIIV